MHPSQENSSITSTVSDHRQRVAALRRERTRSILLREAVQVFAEQGLENAVIGQIIQRAGVARGTFYNHFSTDEALYIAVASEVSDEILRLVDPFVLQKTGAAARVACGLNTVLALARIHPKLARFLDRGGVNALRHGTLVNQIVPRDLIAGIEDGSFAPLSLPLAIDLLLGPLQMAFHQLARQDLGMDYALALTAGILRALGVPTLASQELATTAIIVPTLPSTSILSLLAD